MPNLKTLIVIIEDRSHREGQMVGRENRPDWDIYFMLQAEIAKLRSNCLTRQVGCVLVRENRQIATGYNGTPSGIRNCFEGGCLRCLDRVNGKIESGADLERCLCMHAEANAILQCAVFGNTGSTRGSTLYSTYAPCLECSKMAVSVGVAKVVSLASYPEDGSVLLTNARVSVTRIDRFELERWLSTVAMDATTMKNKS
ncbi:MAG TPA: dCMP deaminase family protein [Nitrososphaeraceae archaeon]|nr:dCMP deaminase family protein [Nitrososphaeraceae archaeon]